MLAFSLGALGISAVIQSSPMDVGLISPVEHFELAYTHHDPIWIQSNQEMIDQADDESWPGNGTAEDPFIITGYSFDSDTQPLRIWNTDLYWIFTANPLYILLPEQGHGILIYVHITTNRDKDIDAVFLLADGDGFAVQETTIQDESFHHPLTHHLHKMFHELIKHRTLVVLSGDNLHGHKKEKVQCCIRMQQCNHLVTATQLAANLLLISHFFVFL